jgi:hypothetical protein
MTRWNSASRTASRRGIKGLAAGAGRPEQTFVTPGAVAALAWRMERQLVDVLLRLHSDETAKNRS